MAESEKSARLAMMELSNMLSVPMALHAVVLLRVPEAIWQSGSNSPLTPSQILSLILPNSPSPSPSPSPSNLQRLLRLLSSHNVFSEHIDIDRIDRIGPSSLVVRRYALTHIGRTLVPNSSSSSSVGSSYSPYVLQHHQDALIRAWPLLHEAVLDPTGPAPFARANGGVPAYAYYGADGKANELMREAMRGVSAPFMQTFLDEYGEAEGFEGVRTIVDVGGSSGACLRMIMERLPDVRAGINFDLPEVVAGAPSFAGVTHVGGDMFESVPNGDAIFMKWVLTTWTDEECELILKNCYNALPAGGKLIACEPVLPEETDSSQRTRALLEGDIFVMAIYRSQGKERTEEEFKQLGQAAGFSSFRALYLDHFYTVLEFQK